MRIAGTMYRAPTLRKGGEWPGLSAARTKGGVQEHVGEVNSPLRERKRSTKRGA
jgi:hypothetical protein